MNNERARIREILDDYRLERYPLPEQAVDDIQSILRDAAVETKPQCGNQQHPDGAWHPSSSIPSTGPRGWLEVIRQRSRQRKWGCSCPTRGGYL